MARKRGPGGMRAVGVVRARGGVGTLGSLVILSKHLGNASQVWVVARKRGPGGVRAVGMPARCG